MASFTRDWIESTPTDDTVAVDIDDYIRGLRVDVSDRIKEMVYGFTNGENDGYPGIKELIFKQQSAAPGTPNANEITLYCIDDGSDAGLYAIQEDGYAKQILKKSGTALLLNVAAADGVCMLTGDQTIAGAKTFSGSIIAAALTASANLDIGSYQMKALKFESDQATGTAPLTVASTTKVTNLNADKVDGYDVAAYDGGESYTFPGGLILKMGETAVDGVSSTTVTFATAFPTTCVRVVACGGYAAGETQLGINVSGESQTGFTAYYYGDGGARITPIKWIAVGK